MTKGVSLALMVDTLPSLNWVKERITLAYTHPLVLLYFIILQQTRTILLAYAGPRMENIWWSGITHYM